MIRAAVTRLADISPQPVRWLWPSRIPLGAITMLDGDPGLGKSTVLLDLAARLSRGDAMPDGSVGPTAGGTVILTAEDDLARVVRPRLDAANADTGRIVTLSIVDRDSEREFEISVADISAVEEAMPVVGAKLVIVDPLMAYLPANVNSNRDQDVRRSLMHLRGLAERSGAAVVVVRHLNKAWGGPALYRGGGSIGIIGAARAGLLLAADPEAPETGRVLAVIKSNLAAKPPALRLELLQASGDAFAHVVWGEACEVTPAQLLAAEEKPQGRGALAAAKEFLRSALAGGAVPARDVESEAADFGISSETLRRARRALGVTSHKIGQPTRTDQQWLWSLAKGVEGPYPVSKPVNSGEDDLLRAPISVSDSEFVASPKEVTPDIDDPLRVVDHDTSAASDEEGIPSVVSSAAHPVSTPRADYTVVLDVSVEAMGRELVDACASTPKEVNSNSDPLRGSAFEKPRCADSRVEEGQAREDDLLRTTVHTSPPGVAESACTQCRGEMLHWSFATICRSCHYRIPDDRLVEEESDPQAGRPGVVVAESVS